MLPTWFQKGALALFIFALILMGLGNSVFSWLPETLLGGTWINPVTNLLPLAIAALGFNILVGVTGQVSIGHAFFMGVGAYTAVGLGGNGDGVRACVPFHDELGLLDEAGQCGLGLPIWIWLPAAGIVATLVGILVSPAAVRVRGLYLAIVTLGLVFIGLHLGRMLPEYAGDFESGRRWPSLDLKVWKEETALVQMTEDGTWFGLIHLSEEQKQFFFLLFLLVIFTVLAKNIIRSRTGRALQAIRDRDIAAEVMGVPEFKYKLIGFAISSFYAGIGGCAVGVVQRPNVAGQLVAVPVGRLHRHHLDRRRRHHHRNAARHRLRRTHPRGGEDVHRMVGRTDRRRCAARLDRQPAAVRGRRRLRPDLARHPSSPGWPMSVFFWNFVIYGVLIVVFLIFEPLGLFGIWLRIKNYWKGWPFSY